MVPIGCRWHLAEALVATGDHAAADRERATAEALANSCGMLLPSAAASGAAADSADGAGGDRTSAPDAGAPPAVAAAAPVGPGASSRRRERPTSHSIGLEQLARILAVAG
jgi:hypothetical protein